MTEILYVSMDAAGVEHAVAGPGRPAVGIGYNIH